VGRAAPTTCLRNLTQATCAAAMEVDGGGDMDTAEVEQPTKLVTERVDLLLRAQVRAEPRAGCGSTCVHPPS
jgi:hypothetical protein